MMDKGLVGNLHVQARHHWGSLFANEICNLTHNYPQWSPLKIMKVGHYKYRATYKNPKLLKECKNSEKSQKGLERGWLESKMGHGDKFGGCTED